MDGRHYANGTLNGNGADHSTNGESTGAAGPSKPYPPTPPSTHLGTSNSGDASHLYSPPSHNDKIVAHIYTAGFQHGNYADVHLDILNRTYRLHAIILSRSPYLAHLINTSGSSSIHVPLEDEPLITEEGFAIALGYLYSSISTTLISPANARAVLAAACLLGGMEDLCHRAYECCKDSFSLENILEWVQSLDFSSPRSQPTSPISTPSTPAPPETVLGPYATRLRDDVFTFLVTTLPQSVHAFPSWSYTTGTIQPPPTPPDSESGYDILIRVYSQLPFDIFKHAVESPAFPVGIGGDQARFRFAKEAIGARKKLKAGRVAEETVVLAFGKEQGGSAVHVARKMKKRPLWKVAK